MSTSPDLVTHDSGYDDPDRELTSLACSDGPNGLMTKYKWKIQGDIAGFPYIGGADVISGWNSPLCGSCWKLEYEGNRIHVMVVDHAGNGFNIADSALDELTDGKGIEQGRINVQATRVSVRECGVGIFGI